MERCLATFGVWGTVWSSRVRVCKVWFGGLRLSWLQAWPDEAKLTDKAQLTSSSGRHCEIFFSGTRCEGMGLHIPSSGSSVAIPSGSSGPRCQAWRKRLWAQGKKLVPQKYRGKLRKLSLGRFNLSGKNRDPQKSFLPRR